VLKSEVTFKDGEIEGPVKKYDENGEISIEEN
jgi:antitoxin component YwqK of YwqJK toxin-antitoxin module